MKSSLWGGLVGRLRRNLLLALVPEWVWPKHVVVDGVTFRVRNTPYSVGTKRLLSFGTENYETEERELLEEFLTPGMNVIELGASIGVLSSIIAERIGPSGSLVSVEASCEIGNYTKSWVEQKYPWVRIVVGVALPLWDSSPLLLRVEGFDSSRGSLGGAVKFAKADGRTLDASRPNGGKIWDLSGLGTTSPSTLDALVVDIEGAEEEISDATLNYPKTLKWVMIELHPDKYRSGSTKRVLLELFEREGFYVHSKRSETYLLARDGAVRSRK